MHISPHQHWLISESKPQSKRQASRIHATMYSLRLSPRRAFYIISSPTSSRIYKNKGFDNVKQIKWQSFSTSSSSSTKSTADKNKNMLMYLLSLTVFVLGSSYAAVPFYKMFCQATGFGGTTKSDVTMDRAKAMVPVTDAKKIKISFAAQTSDTLPWKFVPQQREIHVFPGETALAFYTATNKSDEPVVGVATYNVTPMKAGIYFHKVQCFCFDEQRLRPKEAVDMPVFFYIDPAFLNDVTMRDVTNICLSYTFFPVKEEN